MGILEVFLIKLLLTQLTIGDQLQDVGHETAMPQLDPIMMKQLVENMMVASKEPMVQNLVDRLPVTDFSNFFTGDPSGGEEGGEGPGAASCPGARERLGEGDETGEGNAKEEQQETGDGC